MVVPEIHRSIKQCSYQLLIMSSAIYIRRFWSVTFFCIPIQSPRELTWLHTLVYQLNETKVNRKCFIQYRFEVSIISNLVHTAFISRECLSGNYLLKTDIENLNILVVPKHRGSVVDKYEHLGIIDGRDYVICYM